MKKNNLTFAQFGCGRMGKNTAKFAIEKGAQPVAAFDANPKLVGADLGELIGTDANGIRISAADDADKILGELKPDICIVTTQSLMKDVKDILLTCAKNGVNAITTCEEAFYPWNSSPVLTAEIDKLAKENNCTISGSGVDESQYGAIFALFGGNAHKTEKIYAEAQYNVDDYGIALAKAHGVGLTPEEFEQQVASADNISDEERKKLIEEGKFIPTYVWTFNGWLCDYLGLTVKSESQKCIPKFADRDIRSTTLDAVIPKGNAIGMGAIATLETEEGLTIETQCIGKVYYDNEEDTNLCRTTGVPNLEISFKAPDTVAMTCGSIVNRIPDVINAPAGFVTTSKMPTFRYHHKDLINYIK